MGTLGLIFALIVIAGILGAWYWALAKDRRDQNHVEQRRIYHRPEKSPLP